MDAQVGQHDSTVNVQGLSHWKRETDDHDIIRWCHCDVKGWELYKECVHNPQGSHLGFWLQYIQLHLVRSHRPSLAATSIPRKDWDYNFTEKCSLFVQL